MRYLLHDAENISRSEVVIDVNPAADLQAAGQLTDDVSIEDFTQRYLANLKAVAERRGVTVWVSHDHEQHATDYDDQTLELIRSMWQEAHDKTPAVAR